MQFRVRWLSALILFFCLLHCTLSTGDASAQPAPKARISGDYRPELPPRARAYHAATYSLLAVSIGWYLLGLALFIRSGAAVGVRVLIERTLPAGWSVRRPTGPNGLRAPTFLAVMGYYALFTLLMLLWRLPIGLIGLAIETRFGFSHEPVVMYLRDALVRCAVGWSSVPLIWLVYLLYVADPRRWWLKCWAVVAPLTLLSVMAYPIVVSPLFNRYTPLTPGPLREQILELAATAGIHNGRVLVEDTSRRTSHVNAYVIGLGPSTRIVLNDTALNQLPPDEILAMMAHEMGHYSERHVLIGAIAGAFGSGLILALLARTVPALVLRFRSALRVRGVEDLAALPLVVMLLYALNLAGQPIASGISRAIEHRADLYGLRAAGLSDATARLMIGFVEHDLSDPDPPALVQLWFGTHPTIRERIALARSWKAEKRALPR